MLAVIEENKKCEKLKKIYSGAKKPKDDFVFSVLP